MNFNSGIIQKFEADFSCILICGCQIGDGCLRLPLQRGAAHGLLGRGNFINIAEVTVCSLTALLPVSH